MQKWSIWAIAIICVFLGQAFSATVIGTAYGPDLEKMNKIILEINSTPAQTIVLANGTYEIELSKGTYEIAAHATENKITYQTKETIQITDENSKYTIDLILLPDIAGNESLGAFDEDQDSPLLEDENPPVDLTYILGIIIIVGITLSLFVIHKKRQTEQTAQKKQMPTGELPSDLKELVELIKRHEGRMTQKELRAEIPFSEAKVSLMISDLEDRGIVRRIKTGRSNIVVLREK